MQMKIVVAIILLTLLTLTATSASLHAHVSSRSSQASSANQDPSIDTISASGFSCADLDARGIPHDHCVGGNDVSACAHFYTTIETQFDFRHTSDVITFCGFRDSFYKSPFNKGLIRPPIA